ncbi:YbfB/YjiJ family MFS transporter [Campylobacter sp. MIT 21-1682]|nr:YbfB/YjiJ family MFS transporter [Campylobacter sp. MIT 21-1684]MCX2751295.1 YbfB/YjiJ family MFS transporter [Campylobacter sp. MIT 21-1682]
MICRLFTCFLATFVSNGLARFGYVVLIPLLILSGKMSEIQSVHLAIAILIGYIFGSFMINILHKYISLEAIAKLSFLIIALSFLAFVFDSLPFIFAWLFRFFAGAASAALIALAAPLFLPLVQKNKSSLFSGLIFSGIGFGAVCSGFILPYVASFNIDLVWILLFLVSLVSFLFALFSLKTLNPARKYIQKEQKFHISFFLWLLLLSYGLNAIGYLAHTLFWVDYLVRELGFSSMLAGTSWAFFGIGLALGAFGSGIVADTIGLKKAHIFVLSLKAFSCFIAAYSKDIFLLNLSVFIMGFTTTGNVALTNTMALNIVGKEYFARASSMLTLNFGIFQALFSLLFAFLLSFIGYFYLFIICSFCLVVSFLILLPLKDYKI